MEFAFGLAVWRGLEDACAQGNQHLAVFCGGRVGLDSADETGRNSAFALAKAFGIDGIVCSTGALFMSSSEPKAAEFLEDLRPLPVVSLSWAIPGFPSITTNNRKAMRSLVGHLIEVHGCRSIAYHAGSGASSEAKERLGGYLDALADHQIPSDPLLIFSSNAFPRQSGILAVRALLDERGQSPQALVCFNDEIAFGALHELHSRGLHPPQDLLLTGFDDSAESRVGHPTLTTVHQPMESLGTLGFQLLTSSTGEGRNSLCLEMDTVFRESCGCPGDEGQVVPATEPGDLTKWVYFTRMFVREISGVETLSALYSCFERHWSVMSGPAYVIAQPQADRNQARIVSTNLPTLRVGTLVPLGGFLELCSPDRRLSCQVHPLTRLGDQFGFFLVETVANIPPFVFGTIAEQVSSTLRSLWLFEQKAVVEAQLRESQNRLWNLAMFVPTLALETGPTLILEFANQEASETWGLESGTLKGRELTSLVCPSDRGRFTEFCRRARATPEGVSGDFSVLTRGGAPVLLLIKAVPTRYGDPNTGLRLGGIPVKSFLTSAFRPGESFFQDHGFSPRVREVLDCVLRGLSTKEIAAKLFIAESTVKDHMGLIYQKLGVRNRREFFEKLKALGVDRFGPNSYAFSLLRELMADETSIESD